MKKLIASWREKKLIKKASSYLPLVDKVKVMRSNKTYRFGDLVFQKGIRWREDRKTILAEARFDNSLLKDYLKSLADPEQEGFNIDALKTVVNDHLARHSIESRDDTLLVNIRMGDIVATQEGVILNHAHGFIFEHDRLLKEIELYLDKVQQIKKILIVTAMHFGDNDLKGWYKFSDEAFQKNRDLLSICLMRIADRFSLPVDIIDPYSPDTLHVDIHLLSLINAEHVILDRGGFAELVKQIRDSLA